MEKKARIEIRDLNVDLDELQKKDPKLLQRIRGGAGFATMSAIGCATYACMGGRPPPTAACAGGGWRGGP